MPGNLKVSFVIPTLNAGRTLPACLEAVRRQDYPADMVEIVIADGGSIDNTLEVARQFKVDLVVPNELKTGESGKSAGIKAAKGELIALVDSDNILDGTDWLSRMAAPFSDPEIVASEPLRFVRRPSDPAITRYFAMAGVNDPICLFVGNYDRYSVLTGRWTDLPVSYEKKDGHLKLELKPGAVPTVGANGFVIRRSLLKSVRWEPYFCDIDIMWEAMTKGLSKMAKVDCGIVHLYCRELGEFARKQRRRVDDFLFYRETDKRQYPWDSRWMGGLVKFCVYTITVLPLVAQALRGWLRCHDPAWCYHVPCCWITLWVYGIAFLRRKAGVTPRVGSREGWQQ